MSDYTITPARYAKNRFVVRSPSRDDGWKSEIHWLLENVGARYVHRDHGYQVSKRQAKNFEQLLKAGYRGSFRLGAKQAAEFTHRDTGLRKYTLREALQSALPQPES